MEYLIDKLKIENHEILKRRPDLKINSDFTEDGEKLHSNELKIEQLNKLPIPLVSNCKHENEQMHQGDGFVYVTCKDCGTDL